MNKVTVLRGICKWMQNGIKYSLITLGVIFVLMTAYAFVKSYYRYNVIDSQSQYQYVSRDVSFVETEGGCGYIFNESKNKKTVKYVNWIAKPVDGDSLAVFCRDGKKGYFNMFTGEPVIEDQYDKAWIFSEGIAGVVKNGKLQFINHHGRKVMEREFKPSVKSEGYVFHGGYCPMEDQQGEKVGLIDRQGHDVLPYEYQRVRYANNGNYWHVTKGNKVGLLDSALNVVLPCEYRWINVSAKDGVYVTDSTSICRLYDYDCKTILQDVVIAQVEKLLYEAESEDDHLALVTKQASCFKYCCYSTYPVNFGLMSPSGKILTKPIYTDITAVTKDIYLCQPNGVLLDSEGKKL